MPTISIPSPLRSYVQGQKVIRVEGSTAKEVLLDLIVKYPALGPQVFDPNGHLRAFINIFIGEENILQSKDGLNFPVEKKDSLIMLASIAGG